MKQRPFPIMALLLLAAAQAPAVQAQSPGQVPTEIYKCSEDGKAVYRDGRCASGPNRPLKTHDAKGIEAGKLRAPDQTPPGAAPVASIPYSPSKALGNSTMSRSPGTPGTTCRTSAGYAC